MNSDNIIKKSDIIAICILVTCFCTFGFLYFKDTNNNLKTNKIKTDKPISVVDEFNYTVGHKLSDNSDYIQTTGSSGLYSSEVSMQKISESVGKIKSLKWNDSSAIMNNVKTVTVQTAKIAPEIGNITANSLKDIKKQLEDTVNRLKNVNEKLDDINNN